MKKTKAVSLLLIASMLMPMTGCSIGQKKKVLETAEEYAEAVISGDMGDIADLIEDGDEFEESMEDIASDEDFEEIYDLILENMSYEIDEKSLKVKDKKASVEITYTMIDYMDVYDDLDDDAEIEDYLYALEDAEDNTMEIDQKIELELDKDEWIIVDDDYENILEIYEFYSEIKDLGWLREFNAFTSEQFLEAVEEILGDDDPYVYDCQYFFDSDAAYDGVFANVDIEYTYPEDASMSFDYYYEAFTESVENGSFTGDYSYNYDGSTGYIYFDGYSSSASSFYYGDIYGAVYLTENSCIVVLTMMDDQSKRDTVDEFLTRLGLPCPTF